ncbi:MAG TPA: PTS sugar transporter subunit IIC [Longimicrobiaceae bacterium]|nr:PTS sugar transporter subunit IIC [Longimicrobiaceae bacterium]
MSLDPLTIVLLILFGGWVALDGTSAGQVMLSRPLVAATLAGWIVGAPAEGATLGLLLEALHLMVLPVGAARYPEGGPAAVAGAAAFAAGVPSFAALLTTVVFVLLWEQVGGESVKQLRQLNMALVTTAEGASLSPAQLERRHLAALGIDFLRGAALVIVGMLLLSSLLSVLAPLLALGERLPRLLLSAAVAAALGASVRLFDGVHRARLVLAGAACGLFFLLLR